MHTDKLTDFLESVSQQIRWKKAQPIVLEEIQNHIQDQEMAFIEEGMDEDKAIEKAIKEMGDPVVVGEQLNRVHKPKPDWTLLILISGILFIGMIIQYYLIPTYYPDSEKLFAVSKFYGQLRGIIIGIAVMIAAYFCDFTIIGKYPKIIFFILFSICIYYIFKGNYLNSGIAETIYPLLLFPTAYAGFVYSMRNKGYIGIFLCGVGVLIPAIIAIISPNITTLLLLCISCFIILISAVAKGWFEVRKLWGYLLINIPTIVISIVLFYHLILSQGYRALRLKAFLTFSDPMGANWLNSQVRLLLFHAKLIGKGLPIDQETEVTSHMLPAVHSNFMLTYIIYKLGWIVFIGIILLFSALIVRGLILSRKQKSVLGYLTSQAILITFTIQCILYISANLGFMLFAPLSFPLLSYGGKYLVVNMFLLGLLLSIFRTGNYVRDGKGKLGKTLSFIQYHKGTIHINVKNKTAE